MSHTIAPATPTKSSAAALRGAAAISSMIKLPRVCRASPSSCGQLSFVLGSRRYRQSAGFKSFAFGAGAVQIPRLPRGLPLQPSCGNGNLHRYRVPKGDIAVVLVFHVDEGHGRNCFALRDWRGFV